MKRSKVQQQILRKRGLTPTITGPARRHHRFTSLVPSDRPKTSHMLLLEMRHGQYIEELLVLDTVTKVAKQLAISKGTVTKWKQKLGLEAT